MNALRYNKVYPFTNENLTSYQRLYNFKNKKVLSVLGSGDQYFSSKLYGAKEVVLFDNNATTYLYFIFKFTAIKVLNYQEFLLFFVKYKLNYTPIYVKIRKNLPDDVRKFFDNFYKINKKLGDILLSRTIINDNDLNRDRVIPYLSEQGYYKLQSILNSEDIPKIYICDLLELLNKLDSKYDIVILSNIFMYLNMDVLEFKEFLKLFKSKLKDGGIIQANYVWNNKAEVFKKNGFIVKHVPSAIYDGNKIDSVLSLKL